MERCLPKVSIPGNRVAGPNPLLPTVAVRSNPSTPLSHSSPPFQTDSSQPSQPPSAHAPRSATEPPHVLHPPFQDVRWNEIGLRFVPPQPILNPNVDRNTIKIRFGTDFQAILCPDGSYQGNKQSPHYNQGGCGFICHIFHSRETWIAAKTLPKSDPNNSAPVSEAESTLMGFQFLASKNITRALIVHDNFDMHAFIMNKSRSKKKCSRYANLKDRIVEIMSKMDAVYGCHVRSHQGPNGNGLAENEAADQLASLFMRIPQLEVIAPMLISSVQNVAVPIIQMFKNKFGQTWSWFTEESFPIKSMPTLPASSQCEECGCPSHKTVSCFLLRSPPNKSAFPREKPARRPGFSESFLDPSSIDWDEAPAVLNDHAFVQFMGTMFSLLIQPSTAAAAWGALMTLSAIYFFNPLRSKLVKKKPKPHHDADGLCVDRDTLLCASEEESKRLHTFASIAHERKWGRAMNFVHKTERISPLDARLSDQWDAVHPQPPSPSDELHLDYNPNSFQMFEVDRYELCKKIDSWDVTKASGLTGFPPAILIHFNNLTAKTEDENHPNPYFTSLVLFIQHLAAGKIYQLRDVALNYKGSFLNKVPPHMGFKVRNLGISDTFHRLASYTVLLKSIPVASAAGLLTDFDLGSGKLGGIEKFVKIAQAMAEQEDIVILSSDIEKAYNNTLRTDTWNAIQEINCPALTQWFIYSYGSSPWVNYVIDLNLPAHGNNLKRVELKIGFPQGDSLSGFLFSITLRYILKSYFLSLASSQIPVGFTTVLDDTILAFNSRDTNRIGLHISDFIHVLNTHNLKINVSKSIVYCKEISASLITQIRRVQNLRLSSDGFDVCKIPVGTQAHIQAFIRQNYVPKIDAAYDNMLLIWRALQHLTNQERYNTFFIFLRLCFASKFAYWIRNLLPTSAHPVSWIIDSKIDALSSKLYPQLPSNLSLRQPEFVEMLALSAKIESLPLSLNGAGITRLAPIVHIGHFATCAESFQSVLDFSTLVNVRFNSTVADEIRSRLFPSLNSSITHLLAVCATKMVPNDFAIQPKKEYRGVQKLVSTAFYSTLHDNIARDLPNDHYRAWFTSRKDSFASLTLNSSVRHVTGKRPPLDGVFPMTLALRTFRPIFHLYSCGCGETIDVCGLHLLKCKLAAPSPFVRVHNSVRDATVRSFQDYLRRNSPSNLQAFSETQKFHLCEVKRYYPTAIQCENHRADAIVFENCDPFHPWFLDFVQAQIDTPDEQLILKHLHASHRAKIAELVRDHIGIPRQSIIPIAFASNGVFHPSVLVFVDWFLCRASHKPLVEPPSNEKLKMLHAMTSAIVDSTSSILSEHFFKFINHLHHQSFPYVLSQGSAELAVQRRGKSLRRRLPVGTLNDSGGDTQLRFAPNTGSNTNWPSDPPHSRALAMPPAPSSVPQRALSLRGNAVDYRALASVCRT